MKLSEQQVYERINQRRRQLLVHSFLYYQMNDSRIDDYIYDQFALDLINLQTEYPYIADQCIYADDFRGFQMGDSYKLPYSHPEVQVWAHRFLNACRFMEKMKRGEK